MKIFASRTDLDLVLKFYGRHGRLPRCREPRVNDIARRQRLSGEYRLYLQKYFGMEPLDTVYFVPDEHALGYLVEILNRLEISIKLLSLSRGRELLGLCPGLQILGPDLRVDDIHFKPGVAKIAVVIQCLGFGDCLATLCALREVARRVTLRGAVPSMEIFANPCSQVLDLFRRCEHITAIHITPQPIASLAGFDALLDLTNAEFLHTRSLADSMLEAATVPPISVPADRKRIALVPAPEPSPEVLALAERERRRGSRLVLIAPLASGPTRCMPLGALSRLAVSILKKPRWSPIVASAGIVTQGFNDWSHLSSTFDDFCGIVSVCDAVVSVDTAAYHVADAYDKPALVFFTTNPADVWSAAYPYVIPVQVGDVGPLAGKHISSEPDVVHYAEMQWDGVNFEAVLDRLEHYMGKDHISVASATTTALQGGGSAPTPPGFSASRPQ